MDLLNLKSISKWFDNYETAANHIALPNSNPIALPNSNPFIEFTFEMFLDVWNIYLLFLIKMDKKETLSYRLIKMTEPWFKQKGNKFNWKV